MAGARAAASLSLTIAVAFATLLVVGGILAGPSILDCARDARHLGACLHGKLEQGGLLPAPAPIPVQRPIVPSEPAPPIVAEAPHSAGWIEANATEYEMPAAPGAELSAAQGLVDAGGLAPSAVELTAEVALAAPLGFIDTKGSLDAGSPTTADVALSTTQGRLDASGSLPAVTGPSAEIALADPAGELVARGEAFATPISADVAVAPMPDRLITSGSTGSVPVLTATAEPVAITPPPAPAPPSLMQMPDTIGAATTGSTRTAIAALVAEPAPPAPAKRPIAAQQPKPAPKPPVSVHPQPKAIIKFDRRYPDVVVLPSPNTGKASSFATLQLR